MNHSAHNTFRIVGILLAAAVCLSLPIFYFGMPNGNDLAQHYRFAIAFYDALRSGDLYPVWIGDTNLGFGDVGVRFYPPLAYYVVAFFRFFVSSWNAALASAVCFWFFVGGVGVYFLAREWASEKAALIAALLFILMPYHVNQVYNAGLFGEFAGLAILPFCFLFVQRIILSPSIGNAARLSVAYALLVLSHLPLAIVGSVALLIYSISLLSLANWNLAIRTLGMSVLMAAAASSFYWVRLVTELSFVKHSLPEFTDRTYDFRLNFLASLLYVPAEKYEQTSLWFTDLLFVVTLAMFLPSLVVCLLKSGQIDRRRLAPWLALLVFVLVLGTPLSVLLWEHVSLLQRLQFPWRLLGLLSIVASIFVAISFDELVRIFRTNLRPISIMAAGLIVAGSVFTFAQVIRPAAYPDRQSFEANFESYRADESFECWWPVLAKRAAFENRQLVSASHRSVQISEWSNEKRTISLGEGDAEKIRVATFYYPYWTARADSISWSVAPADDGTILVPVRRDETEFTLTFDEPTHERLAKIVSAFAWLALIAAALVAAAQRFRSPKIA